MLKKIVLAAFAAALVVLVMPAAVSAYGACHVGYTHVGPSGVYHSGETVARGPEGTPACTPHWGRWRVPLRAIAGPVRLTGTYGAHYPTGSSGSSQIYAAG